LVMMFVHCGWLIFLQCKYKPEHARQSNWQQKNGGRLQQSLSRFVSSLFFDVN